MSDAAADADPGTRVVGVHFTGEALWTPCVTLSNYHRSLTCPLVDKPMGFNHEENTVPTACPLFFRITMADCLSSKIPKTSYMQWAR